MWQGKGDGWRMTKIILMNMNKNMITLIMKKIRNEDAYQVIADLKKQKKRTK